MLQHARPRARPTAVAVWASGLASGNVHAAEWVVAEPVRFRSSDRRRWARWALADAWPFAVCQGRVTFPAR